MVYGLVLLTAGVALVVEVVEVVGVGFIVAIVLRRGTYSVEGRESLLISHGSQSE